MNKANVETNGEIAGPTVDRTVIRAVSVALLRGRSVLMVLRGREPARGQYAFPGGRVEPGETEEDAARRELMEETGLRVETLEVFKDITLDGERDGVAVQYRLLVFCGRAMDGEPRAGDDAEAVGWYDLEEISRLPVTASTREIATALLEGIPHDDR